MNECYNECYIYSRDGRLLNLGSPRGGVSLENEKTPQYTRSTLLVTRAVPDDSGNYTCTPTSGHPASVTVHVLDGEYLKVHKEIVDALLNDTLFVEWRFRFTTVPFKPLTEQE